MTQMCAVVGMWIDWLVLLVLDWMEMSVKGEPEKEGDEFARLIGHMG